MLNLSHYLGFVSLQFQDIVWQTLHHQTRLAEDRFLARGNIKVIDIFINTAWAASKDVEQNKNVAVLDLGSVKVLPA